MKAMAIKAVLMMAACLTLATPTLAQRTTRVFQVDRGGRVPHRLNETASRLGEWTEFTFTVGGFRPGEVIIDVNINIDMVHSWVEDLEIRLESPRGTWIRLFDQLPGGPPRFDNFDNTYFTDGATDIRQGSAPYNGNFSPMEPLSRFQGETPNGTWTLRIRDHYHGDYGYLYKRNDRPFEADVPGAPRWRGPLVEPDRRSEWGNPFLGGTWLEITVPEPSSLLALAPALGWLLMRRRR